MAITPLPPAPEPTDSTAQFNSKAFAWVGAIDQFTTEANALAVAADADATTAVNAKNDAESARDGAIAAANVTKWVSGTTYAEGAVVWSPISFVNYRRKTAGGGTTDPSSDSTNWEQVTGTGNVSLTGTQTLTNKTIDAPIINGATISTSIINGANNTITNISLSTSVTGVLPIANGGTSATTTSGALNALLPSQAGNIDKLLKTDGTNVSWVTPPKVPIGALQTFIGPTTTTYPGAEWLLCDGSIALKSSYSDLSTKVDLYFSDGVSRTTGVTSSRSSLAYGNSRYVSGSGSNGQIISSSDGVTWTLRTSGTTSGIQQIVYGNTEFVYVGTGGVVGTSTDGETWTTRTSGTTSNILSITYGNGLYVYAGAGGVLATSTNGVTWTARTSGVTREISSVRYVNSRFVYFSGDGGSHIVGHSTNGTSWTTTNLGSYQYGMSRDIQYFGGKYYFAVQVNTPDRFELRSSTDLITFSTQTIRNTGHDNANLILFQNRLLMVRNSAVVDISSDGGNWTSNVLKTNTTGIAFAIYQPTSELLVYCGGAGFIATSSLDYDIDTEFKLPTKTVTTKDTNVTESLFIKAL